MSKSKCKNSMGFFGWLGMAFVVSIVCVGFMGFLSDLHPRATEIFFRLTFAMPFIIMGFYFNFNSLSSKIHYLYEIMHGLIISDLFIGILPIEIPISYLQSSIIGSLFGNSIAVIILLIIGFSILRYVLLKDRSQSE